VESTSSRLPQEEQSHELNEASEVAYAEQVFDFCSSQTSDMQEDDESIHQIGEIGERLYFDAQLGDSNIGVDGGWYSGYAPDELAHWPGWNTELEEQPKPISDDGSTTLSRRARKRDANRPPDTQNLIIGVDDVRTVMIQNIPCRYSYQDMLDVFSEMGFGSEPLFFHMPCRYKQQSNLGYAFVGFNDKDITARFAAAMTGYMFNGSASTKQCVVTPARIQGMRRNMTRFGQRRKYNLPRLSM
jgi:hypothetical protein